MALLAPAFEWAIPLGQRPILVFVTGAVAASLIFFTVISLIVRRPPQGRRDLLLIVLAGLLARALLLPGAPILEDDHYRYLWDGAVTAQGLNPYTHPPLRFVRDPGMDSLLVEFGLAPSALPTGFETLASNGRPVLGRINHPHLSTIYPPTAQLGFAASHLIAAWQLWAWKLILIAADVATFALLLGALVALGRPLAWSAIYWLNPLVLKEFGNSGHMDGLMMPALAAALWALAAGRQRLVAAALTVAAAVKFWPLLLLPAALGTSRRAIWSGAAVLSATLLLVAPQVAALTPDSGLTRYAADWQRNALAFPAVAFMLGWVSDDPDGAARTLVATLLVAVALWLGFRRLPDPSNRIAALGTITALFVLLGPTGYPWYATWLLPFAVLVPDRLWLLIVACAPAYYLRFHFEATGRPDLAAVVPPLLAFGPAWALIAWRSLHRLSARG